MIVSLSVVVSKPNVFFTVSVPVSAFSGSSTRICVGPVTVNRTDIEPSNTAVAPVKLAPRSVTHLAGPVNIGSNESITGVRVTVSATPLVPKPNGLTTLTWPVVALAGTVKSSCCNDGVLCPAALAGPTYTAVTSRKFTPRNVTFMPGATTPGDTPVITGARVMVNRFSVAAWPRVETRVIVPLAVSGTVAFSCVLATTVNTARTLPNHTVSTDLKLTPRITTESPGAPTHESRLSIIGPGPATTNDPPLAPVSSCETVIMPLVTFGGTTARICVVAVTLKLAGRPPNFTAVTPVKFCPSMVTIVPSQPRAG